MCSLYGVPVLSTASCHVFGGRQLLNKKFSKIVCHVLCIQNVFSRFWITGSLSPILPEHLDIGTIKVSLCEPPQSIQTFFLHYSFPKLVNKHWLYRCELDLTKCQLTPLRQNNSRPGHLASWLGGGIWTNVNCHMFHRCLLWLQREDTLGGQISWRSLGVSVRVSLGEIIIWVDWLSKADCPA